jgi:hypothetical protein
MEHRGVEYRIIQGIKRGFWKWSVETETEKNSGTSDSSDAATAAAKRAIDNALDPKRRKLTRQRTEAAHLIYLNIVLIACQNDGLSRR